jgi:hypothetical protein
VAAGTLSLKKLRDLAGQFQQLLGVALFAGLLTERAKRVGVKVICHLQSPLSTHVITKMLHCNWQKSCIRRATSGPETPEFSDLGNPAAEIRFLLYGDRISLILMSYQDKK